MTRKALIEAIVQEACKSKKKAKVAMTEGFKMNMLNDVRGFGRFGRSIKANRALRKKVAAGASVSAAAVGGVALGRRRKK